MPFAEYAHHDALGLADLVRRGEVTPGELVDEALARIARVDPTLHAVTARLDDHARAQLAAPLPDGPFRGVPFALKDLVASLTGTPMTSSSRLMRGHVCAHDTELVRRYRDAGLVVVARAAASELGLLPVTEPEAYGPTGSPWAPDRAAGGSSGGSASLVASGALPMAHGGDGGGSLRIPASCCGAFGFKPTRGRTPTAPAGEHWLGLAVEHAVTRSVRDSAALLDATSAPDPGAPYPAPPPARRFLDEVAAPPGRLRIAWTATPLLPSTVHPDAIAAVEDAARLCGELGHQVEPAAPPIDPDRFARAFLVVIGASVALDIVTLERTLGRTRRRGELEATTELTAMYGRSVSAARLAVALEELRALGRTMAAFHDRHDVLLTPTVATPPPLHGALRSTGLIARVERALARARVDAVLRLPGVVDAMAAQVFQFIPWTPLANATGAPSMSVPLWWNGDDLPIGAMFTARPGDEATLFRLAGQLEAARPWAARRPKVHAY